MTLGSPCRPGLSVHLGNGADTDPTPGAARGAVTGPRCAVAAGCVVGVTGTVTSRARGGHRGTDGSGGPSASTGGESARLGGRGQSHAGTGSGVQPGPAHE